MNISTPSTPDPGSSLNIRVATSADRPRLIRLINSAFSIETFLEGTRTDDERLAAMMEKGSVLMAEDSSGCLLASVYLERRGERGYLGMLAVDPAHQGKGFARRMVQAAEDQFRAQGCRALEIVVLNLRPDLLPIYRRFGFVETETIDFKTSRPLKPGFECHGIVMEKTH